MNLKEKGKRSGRKWRKNLVRHGSMTWQPFKTIGLNQSLILKLLHPVQYLGMNPCLSYPINCVAHTSVLKVVVFFFFFFHLHTFCFLYVLWLVTLLQHFVLNDYSSFELCVGLDSHPRLTDFFSVAYFILHAFQEQKINSSYEFDSSVY